MKKQILSLAVAMSLPVFLSTPVFAAANGRHLAHTSSRPSYLLGRHHHAAVSGVAASTSTNWSGYAVTGNNGAFTSVTSSWTQPAVKCSGVTSLAYSS